jgi:hypothetical protein
MLNRGKRPYQTLTEISDHAVEMDELLHEGTSSKGASNKRKMDIDPTPKVEKKRAFFKRAKAAAKAKAMGKKAQGAATLKSIQGSPLSDEEKQKLMDEGKCFLCKQKGHRANACPQSKNKSKKEN